MEALAKYRNRLAAERREAAILEKQFRMAGNARLLVASAGVALGFAVFGNFGVSPWVLLVPAAVFLALAIWHERVQRRAARARRAAEFYERGIARIEDRWAGTGEAGERFRDASHLYAEDLDVFGPGSLFQLLCTARTNIGQETLARWLLEPAGRQEALERQQAVEELAPRTGLRERLAVIAEEIRPAADSRLLAEWSGLLPVGFPAGARPAALALVCATVAALAVYMLRWTGPAPLLILLLVQSAFAFRLRARVRDVIVHVDQPASDLALLSRVLEELEREHFDSPLLSALSAKIRSGGHRASGEIARLGQLLSLLDSRRHQAFGLVAAGLLWTTQFAMAIEAWRTRSGRHVREWLDAAGQIEALSSFAALRLEHPEYCFPTLEETGPSLRADALAHPLLKRDATPNDVRIGGNIQLWIVSGSNMSGKSTLLRTVGLNAVLAWAGAPVRAARMSISPVAVGASIRVQDSLQDGRSRFYAEITRIRQIVELAGQPRPALFLIDEMLSGTNSHDRKIGAEAILRGLVERGAFGLVTTHDLALSHIAGALGGRAQNVHFADVLEDGQLRFDYRLRSGVVQHSNALALMRSVGLDV